MDLSGSWKGYFSYGNESALIEGFELTISEDEGGIQGVGCDLTSDELRFTISGFFEDGVLSFIKRYEGFYFEDENGNTYLDKEMPSDDIQYTGTYSLRERAFIGSWEILTGENQVGLQEEYDITDIFGEFKLSKVPEAR